jgi:D-alanine-D-alanine ligase
MNKSATTESVAILYQADTPPAKNRIIKPMKPGGYSDSGADIGFALKQAGIDVITPVDLPDVERDLDWVFPDTRKGIADARARGATILWLNTVLFAGHPVEDVINNGMAIIGQVPRVADIYDDKLVTNELLRSNHVPIPESVLIHANDVASMSVPFIFPVVVKPVRGRGSQGVVVVRNAADLPNVLNELFAEQRYGDAIYMEPYLPGEEITITVMPPGNYILNGKECIYEKYWSLPPVKRFNHQDGVAPYNGVVAVINNSRVLNEYELETDPIKSVCRQCERAAYLVHAKAPVRIDCRADATGTFFLFDLNMKPNMTGASRPNRIGQDSLTALAARKIGWSFTDLLLNMFRQRWTLHKSTDTDTFVL